MRELDSKHTECPEIEIGEYLYGSHGGAIIINQTDIESNQRLEFCNAYWHELGHFYAISSQQPDLTRYSEPGLVDDSHNFNIDSGIPTLGLSDERIIQEGYWFWQEFIAQAIANTVRYHFYPTHQMNWHACHYCFESQSLPDRCPDCGAVMFGEKSAVRPATENEKTELLQIRAEDND